MNSLTLLSSAILYYSVVSNAQTFQESTSITSFNDQLVECSLPTCVIICDTDYGCNALNINASKSDSLELYCSSSSACNGLNIVDGPSHNLTVSCEGSSSCDSMILNSPYSWRIDITCVGFASCSSADFNVASALQVDINCLGWSCMSVHFGVEDVHRLSFSGAMQFTEMNAISIVESFNVDCSGTCNDVSMYCPMSENVQCNVYCNGCLNFELFPASFGQLDLQCNARELACDGVTVFCPQDAGNVAGLSTGLRYSQGSFICENERCCPDNMRQNTTTVYCSTNECEMTCLNGGCPIKSILDASNASSLLLECSSDAECEHLSVICPEHGVCDIRCTAPYACQYIDISASNASSLSILCEADYSCQYLQIDAAVVDSADISCSASYSCRDARIEIVGVAMHTNTTLTARQTQSFRSSLIYVTNSNLFNVECTPSNSAYAGTCGVADFHANNINEMNVVCEGSLCAEYVRWSLTANDVSFFCGGDNSCYNMEIYAAVQNTFALHSDTYTALDRAELYVSCDDQMLISGCNQNISAVCGGEDETLGPWPPSNPNNDTCANCSVDGTSASHQILFGANSWDIVCPIADMTTTVADDPTTTTERIITTLTTGDDFEVEASLTARESSSDAPGEIRVSESETTQNTADAIVATSPPDAMTVESYYVVAAAIFGFCLFSALCFYLGFKCTKQKPDLSDEKAQEQEAIQQVSVIQALHSDEDKQVSMTHTAGEEHAQDGRQDEQQMSITEPGRVKILEPGRPSVTYRQTDSVYEDIIPGVNALENQEGMDSVMGNAAANEVPAPDVQYSGIVRARDGTADEEDEELYSYEKKSSTTKGEGTTKGH